MIFVLQKKDRAAVLNSSRIEGVRFPFSNMGASFPPMKVVKGARPGREGTVVDDIVSSKEDSGDVFVEAEGKGESREAGEEGRFGEGELRREGRLGLNSWMGEKRGSGGLGLRVKEDFEERELEVYEIGEREVEESELR